MKVGLFCSQMVTYTFVYRSSLFASLWKLLKIETFKEAMNFFKLESDSFLNLSSAEFFMELEMKI